MRSMQRTWVGPQAAPTFPFHLSMALLPFLFSLPFFPRRSSAEACWTERQRRSKAARLGSGAASWSGAAGRRRRGAVPGFSSRAPSAACQPRRANRSAQPRRAARWRGPRAATAGTASGDGGADGGERRGGGLRERRRRSRWRGALRRRAPPPLSDGPGSAAPGTGAAAGRRCGELPRPGNFFFAKKFSQIFFL